MPGESQSVDLPDWTKYGEEEYVRRLTVILDRLVKASPFLTRKPTKQEFASEAVSWMYALEEVPTFHLGGCFDRAIRTHTAPRPLLASDVLRVYEEVKMEVAQRQEVMASAVGADAPLQLGTIERDQYVDEYKPMSLVSWKEQHNLPKEWRLGDDYPPESDLYGKDGNALLQHQRTEELPEIYSETMAEGFWHKRREAPWELIPNREQPEIRKVGIKKTLFDEHGHRGMTTIWKEYINYVDRCSEIDYGPDVPCPGYVIEHYGPDGKWERRLPCPMHQNRREG